jgi:hypothetical protein
MLVKLLIFPSGLGDFPSKELHFKLKISRNENLMFIFHFAPKQASQKKILLVLSILVINLYHGIS